MYDCWGLEKQIKHGIDNGVYDPAILDYYTSDELQELDRAIDHDRDMKFTYAGFASGV